MPELPEVETVRRTLAPHIEGRRIVQVKLARTDLRFPLSANFAARLTGARLMQLTRRGKYLLADMQGEKNKAFVWLSHLGMTGRYIYCPPQAKAAEGVSKHVHVALVLDDGGRLYYADPRRFGFMDLIDGSPSTSKFLAHLGPEALSNEFNEISLLKACAGSSRAIKNLLLDQRVVAGLGNIYVCEALFLAAISPRRKATNLGLRRVMRLVAAIRTTLQAAIEAGGSTLRDFAASDGQLGYFQHQFQVYNRADETCSRSTCRAKVKRLVQSGRSSFYCPACQK